jgi:hypothetical protein
MKLYSLKSIPLLCIPCFLWLGYAEEHCNIKTNFVLQNGDTNLISNSNFEINGKFSLTGWEGGPWNNNDNKAGNPLSLVSNEINKNEYAGGADYADYYIVGISGTNQFLLKTTWKIARRNSFVYKNASVTVGIFSNKKIVQTTSITIRNQDTLWTKDSITCSFSTNKSDTIVVRLDGGICIPNGHIKPDGIFLYKNIELIKH